MDVGILNMDDDFLIDFEFVIFKMGFRYFEINAYLSQKLCSSITIYAELDTSHIFGKYISS